MRIKSLIKKHSIQATVSGKGNNMEVECANEKEMKKFCKFVANWGGYRTGYGSWILRGNYQSKGDFNYAGSAHHY